LKTKGMVERGIRSQD